MGAIRNHNRPTKSFVAGTLARMKKIRLLSKLSLDFGQVIKPALGRHFDKDNGSKLH